MYDLGVQVLDLGLGVHLGLDIRRGVPVRSKGVLVYGCIEMVSEHSGTAGTGRSLRALDRIGPN